MSWLVWCCSQQVLRRGLQQPHAFRRVSSVSVVSDGTNYDPARSALERIGCYLLQHHALTCASAPGVVPIVVGGKTATVSASPAASLPLQHDFVFRLSAMPCAAGLLFAPAGTSTASGGLPSCWFFPQNFFILLKLLFAGLWGTNPWRLSSAARLLRIHPGTGLH